MKRSLLVFFGFVLIASCSNNNKTSTKEKENDQKQDKTGNDKDESGDKGAITQYKWREAEQKKFLADCQKESSDNISKTKLKDFCLCMLTEAQKYYPSYSQMDEKSDEDNDEEIFKKCVGTYGNDNDR
jgi:hypothetical protein